MNAFDALCELASSEGWCWKFPCSTCANMEFRYGFLELAKGKHPHDEDWIMSSDDITTGKVYKFPYNYPFEYPLEDREAVLNICLDSDLSVINDLCSFPEWLGYLGLVMQYMNSWREESYPLYGRVSRHWAKQLKEMIPKSSVVHKRLESIISNDSYGYSLGFTDLEACEKAMNGEELKEAEQRDKIRNYHQSIAYDSLVEIINNPGCPYSSEVAIYARQEDIDKLNDEAYEKLCKMYAHLSVNADTPWAKFKEKFLNGRQ